MNTELTIKNNRNNGLAKYERPLSPELSRKESEVVRASRSPFCHVLMAQGDPEVNYIITRALNDFASRTGYTKAEGMDEVEFGKLVTGMAEAVELNRWLKVQELDLILSRGMLGEFGEFKGMHGLVLNNWLKTYLARERATALIKQRDFEAALQEEAEKAKELENQKVYTPQQRERLIASYRKLQEHYNPPVNWKHVPPEIDTGHIWYNRFWRAGLQRVDRATWVRYVSEAENRLRHSNTHKHLGEADRKTIAEVQARHRIVREKIAELLNARQDIEEVLNHVGL
jgi:hypothetical protein